MTVESGVVVRVAEPEDEGAVRQFWRESGLGTAGPDEWAALIAGETSLVLVAEAEGHLVGTAITAFDGWRAYIYHVAVDPRQRRQGLGHQLLVEAEKYLLAAGARHVFVTVHEQNTEGLALVASAGYLPEGEIVLAKRLATRLT